MSTTQAYRRRETETRLTVEEEYYPVWPVPRSRSARRAPTSEMQQQLNDTKSLLNFTRLVNNNFNNYTDIKVEFTYNDKNKPSDIDDAKKRFDNFLRRLRRKYESLGIELKYVVVDEVGANGTMRPHHHAMITGGIEFRELKRLWGNGAVKIAPVDFDTYGYDTWTAYVYKNPRFCRKWRGSKNLTKPITKERDSENNRRRATKIIKDYNTGGRAALKANGAPGYEIDKVEIIDNPYNRETYIRIVWLKPDRGKGP